MGTIECSQPASKSSWDSQDFGDISMGLKWPIFASPRGHDELMRFHIQETIRAGKGQATVGHPLPNQLAQ